MAKKKNQQIPTKKENKAKVLSSSEIVLTQKTPFLSKYGGWILVLLAFLLYSNTLGHKFAFDDSIVITDNTFTQKGIAGIPDLISRDFFEGVYGKDGMELSGGRFRPLSLVCFAVENQAFGKVKELNGQPVLDEKGQQLYDYNPALGHFLNILFYALSALLLFNLLSLWFSGTNGASVIPFVAGLIFVAHPIHTEVVANIKSRDEILAMLLLFGALYACLLYTSDAADE